MRLALMCCSANDVIMFTIIDTPFSPMRIRQTLYTTSNLTFLHNSTVELYKCILQCLIFSWNPDVYLLCLLTLTYIIYYSMLDFDFDNLYDYM